MIRETKTDGVATMFTRLVKSISVVVLILVLASSVSLAGVGDVHRSLSMTSQGCDLAQIYGSVVLFLTALATV
jgi:hypothetical protein